MNEDRANTKLELKTSDEDVVCAMRNWLERAVIGLNLCPFAKAVHVKHQVRYVVSAARSEEQLCADLRQALRHLAAADPSEVETTLLIHPHVLGDFLAYNDFLDVADEVIDDLQLTGEIQIASFHPRYQFAGTEIDALENYTNRSPYPMLQLLRESSIEKAVEDFPDVASIYERNIETLQNLGREQLEKYGFR